jgi:cob(I)alamin adenosyltransferase
LGNHEIQAMKIYTKTGDRGETGLFGGPRVRKDHPRIEAYGTVDELNAVLGKVRSGALPTDIDTLLAIIQNELFDLGAELATPDPAKHGTNLLGSVQIAALESAIDRYEATLEPLKQFILPGGASEAADLHLARTVCRRAERHLISLGASEPISGDLVIYLNRLSDLLFVLARVANHLAGQKDVPWQTQDKRPKSPE